MSKLVVNFESVPLMRIEEFASAGVREKSRTRSRRSVGHCCVANASFLDMAFFNGYGVVLIDDCGGIAAFRRGEDQSAYDELMELIRGNAAK